jgi:hypothetical protein
MCSDSRLLVVSSDKVAAQAGSPTPQGHESVTGRNPLTSAHLSSSLVKLDSVARVLRSRIHEWVNWISLALCILRLASNRHNEFANRAGPREAYCAV